MKKEALFKDYSDILKRWENVLNQASNDIVRDSAILRFELTYEVAWKLLQLVLREEGYEINSPRQAFQQAFLMGWLRDEEIWPQIIRARNTAVHVYHQKQADELYHNLPDYFKAFKELEKALVISKQ